MGASGHRAAVERSARSCDATVEWHRVVQGALQRIIDPVQARLLQPLVSRQHYRTDDVTSDPRPNGRPPRHSAFADLIAGDFNGWRFEVTGLVEHPLSHVRRQVGGAWSWRRLQRHRSRARSRTANDPRVRYERPDAPRRIRRTAPPAAGDTARLQNREVGTVHGTDCQLR